MKISELIGEEPDPLIEEVVKLFSKHSALIQNRMCRTPTEWRQMEWQAAKEIIETVRRNLP